MRVLRAIFVLAILIAGIALVYIYAGAYDVAATTPHSAAGRWLLDTVMRNSVRAGARFIVPPDKFDDPAMAAQGGKMYGAMCQSCHGGPGVALSELARGLRPRPPDLARAAPDWKPRELFWIVKHGIKMTGMPAWGASRKDPDLWAVVAFVRKLPTMTPRDYQAYVRDQGPSEGPKVSSATDGDDKGAATPAMPEGQPADAAKVAPDGQAQDVASEEPADTAEPTPANEPATGMASKTAPEGQARDVATAEPADTAEPTPANEPATDTASKAAPDGQARDVAREEPAETANAMPPNEPATGTASKVTPDGQPRDVAREEPIDKVASTPAIKRATGLESEAATRPQPQPVVAASAETPAADNARGTDQPMRTGPQPRVHALPQPKPPIPGTADSAGNTPEINQAMQTGPQPRVRALPQPKPEVPEPPRRRRRR